MHIPGPGESERPPREGGRAPSDRGACYLSGMVSPNKMLVTLTGGLGMSAFFP